MIFQFPNLETLRLTLSSGLVPPAVSLAAADVSFDSDGRPAIEPQAVPTKPVQNALKRLGIQTPKTHPGESRTVASWLEIVPLERDAGSAELTATVPVLFEMPVSRLALLATEMLRLGNDRQSFRIVKGSDPDSVDTDRVLLQVIGPPYYTLLRALDHLDSDIAVFVEKAPRIWVEIGYKHSLAAQMTVPEDRLLLLRPPNRWMAIDDGPFQDIYSILDFQLPKAPVDFVEGKLSGKLQVPLRFVPGNAAELPEMWVLRTNALETFDLFVRDADDRLTGRLMFAVAEERESGPIIILRTRPSKLPPPAIDLPGAIGYVPFRRLNNLFLPASTRLQPTLRRDAVRALLADDPAQIVWLSALGEGRFLPEALPDDAFRPLQDWVDYIIDHDRQTLQNWIQATQFDFESFICRGELPMDRPKPAKAQASKSPVEPAEIPKGKKPQDKVEEANFAAPIAPSTPRELKIERERLENEFLAIEGSLEAPERQALWPRLARVNGNLNDLAEASVCWLHALWERDQLPAEWLRNWLESEEKTVDGDPAGLDLNRELALAAPSQGDMRRLAAKLLLSCTQKPISAALKERLPEIRRYLEKHEESLGVRAIWLVWQQLSRIGGDILGLARVRDRLVDRLLQTGLKPQYDVANFVRFAGQRDSDRLRKVQDHLLQFRGEVQAWLAHQDKAKDGLHCSLYATGWYADLIIAYGLAKIGEERHCSELTAGALAKLRAPKEAKATLDPIPLFLADAFAYRIEQAAKNLAVGPLPPRVLKSLEGQDMGLMYTVNRLRKQLHILEPHEKSDPYLLYKKRNESNRHIELAALALIPDPKILQLAIKRIWNNAGKPLESQDRCTMLIEMIPLTTRIGEAFAFEMFAHVLPTLVLNGAAEPREIELQARLIDASVPIAANYGWTELLRQILTKFVGNLRSLDDVSLIKTINLALGQWLRVLRKCGMKDELESLLKELTGLLLKSRSLETLRIAYSHDSTRKHWVDLLQALLQLAESWVYFGWHAQALPFIEEARLFLFDNKNKNAQTRPVATQYASLANSYLRAIGQNGDLEFVAARYSELLKKMDRIPNTQTTSNYYSGLHLGIVESIVLALVSDDFILGETARRWLDDDEYLVRRRIHGDMRKLLTLSGL